MFAISRASFRARFHTQEWAYVFWYELNHICRIMEFPPKKTSRHACGKICLVSTACSRPHQAKLDTSSSLAYLDQYSPVSDHVALGEKPCMKLWTEEEKLVDLVEEIDGEANVESAGPCWPCIFDRAKLWACVLYPYTTHVRKVAHPATFLCTVKFTHTINCAIETRHLAPH